MMCDRGDYDSSVVEPIHQVEGVLAKGQPACPKARRVAGVRMGGEQFHTVVYCCEKTFSSFRVVLLVVGCSVGDFGESGGQELTGVTS